MEYFHHATFGISALGVPVIIFGVLCSLLRFVRSEVWAGRGADVVQRSRCAANKFGSLATWTIRVSDRRAMPDRFGFLGEICVAGKPTFD